MPKISALPPNVSPDGDDELPGVDDSTSSTIKWTLNTIKAWLQALAGWVSTAMLAAEAVTDDKRTALKFCTVYRSAALNIPTASYTAINFDAEISGSEDWHDSGSNPSRITVDEDGLYLVAGQLGFSGSTSGQFRIGRITVSGSDVSPVQSHATDQAQGSGAIALPLSPVTRRLVAGDYIEMLAYQNTGGNLSVVPGSFRETWLSVTKLSD